MEEKPKKKFYKKVWFWIVVVVIVLFIIIGSSGNSKSATSIPAPAETGSTVNNQPQAGIETNAPASTQTLLDITGSGSKSTAKFTAASDWDLNWSYDCSNFGEQGNFIVSIYNGDSTMSFENTGVNQLGKSDASVEHYHTGGTFYLTVNSECKWKIQVKG